MIPKRKNVIGLQGYDPSAEISAGRGVLFDTNALIASEGASRKREGLHSEDFSRWWSAVHKVWGSKRVQIPTYIQAEVSKTHWARVSPPEDELTQEDVKAFIVRHGKRLLPTNQKYADLAIFAEAVLRKKYIVSLDAWVVGKAQAAGVIFPTLKGLRFGNKNKEAARQAAFDAW